MRVLTSDLRGWQALELLDRYAPATELQAVFRERMFALLATTAEPFKRSQCDPGHFTASCFVVETDARVLLISHPTLGRWLQPGGHVEDSDTSLFGAAEREVQEETGLTVRVERELFDIDIHEIPPRATSRAHLHFDLRFLAVVARGAQPTNPEGVEGRWLRPVDALAIGNDASVARMIAKVWPSLGVPFIGGQAQT